MAPAQSRRRHGSIGRAVSCRELADDLEHAEARLAFAAGDRVDQALVGQRGETVERLDPELGAGVADLVGRLERPAAGEDGEPDEQPPLGRVEQLVAPVDRAPERALPSGQVLAPLASTGRRRSSRSRIASAPRTLIRAAASSIASGSPSSRLQISATAGRVLVRDLEVGLDGARAFDEQRDGLVLRKSRGGRRRGGVGKVKRRDAELLLPGQVQHRAARDDDPQPRRSGEQLGDERRGAHDLLEVVEDQQQLALAEVLLHPLLEVAIGRLPDAQGGGDGRGGRGAVASILEGDEEGAVGEIGQEALREREPEACLARAARAGERDQASLPGGAR